MGSATLLADHATIGWFGGSGQLWLLDEGLLRLPRRLGRALLRTPHDPSPGERVAFPLTREQVETLAASRRGVLWVPRESVVRAESLASAGNEGVRLELATGRRVTLRWLSGCGGGDRLRDVLATWAGSPVPGRRSPLAGMVPTLDDPGPARRWPGAALTVGPIVLVGVVLALTGLDQRLPVHAVDACRDARRHVAGYHQEPGAAGAGLHPAATVAAAHPLDDELRAYLLDAVASGTFVHTRENSHGIVLHAELQHRPEAREVAERHGFVRQVSREWVDEHQAGVRHLVTQFSSQRDAESFLVHTAVYTCRFAREVWEVDVPGAELPGLGMRVRHQEGAADQVTWVRGGRRHHLSIFDPSGEPDRALLHLLVERAAPRDAGTTLGAGSP